MRLSYIRTVKNSNKQLFYCTWLCVTGSVSKTFSVLCWNRRHWSQYRDFHQSAWYFSNCTPSGPPPLVSELKAFRRRARYIEWCAAGNSDREEKPLSARNQNTTLSHLVLPAHPIVAMISSEILQFCNLLHIHFTNIDSIWRPEPMYWPSRVSAIILVDLVDRFDHGQIITRAMISLLVGRINSLSTLIFALCSSSCSTSRLVAFISVLFYSK